MSAAPTGTTTPTSTDTTTDHSRRTTMTDIERRFETPGAATLTVEVQQGDVTLMAGDRTDTVVRLVPHGRNGEEIAERYTVEAHGSDVTVTAPKGRDGLFSGLGWRGHVDVVVELPTGSRVDARTGSGDVSAHGLLGDVRAHTGSGDLSLQDLDSADLKSGSGDVVARAVAGGVSAKTGSGDITLESAGGHVDLVSGSGDLMLRRAEATARLKTGSGDVVVGSSAGDLDIMTGTGDVKLEGVHGGEIRAKTGTGDVAIFVAAGVAAYLDLNTVTGDVDVHLDETDGPDGSESQASLAVQSGSGDVLVSRARVRVS